MLYFCNLIKHVFTLRGYTCYTIIMKTMTHTAKKSLRMFGLMLAVILAATSLSSCDPDDDNYYYDITGSWMEVAPDYGNIYYFYGDGTGYCQDYNGEYYFDWDVDDWNLYLDFYDGYYETYGWSMQGNSLYLYPDGGNPIVLQPY